MRLLRLDLKAVGPFTDVALDLAAGHHGLHLIHGPNEAGKTSALRALSYMLFGFQHTTTDDFVHPYNQLRVGGTLRHSDGDGAGNRPPQGAKNDLRGADDTMLVLPGELERFLGGLDRDTFETLFGIDQARLAQAGEEIRTGQGRLGELLFAAGTGLAGLRLAQERLQKQLDDLFKPRARSSRSTRGWPSSAHVRTSSRSSSSRATRGTTTTAPCVRPGSGPPSSASRSPGSTATATGSTGSARPAAGRPPPGPGIEAGRPGDGDPPPRRLRPGEPRRARECAATGLEHDRAEPGRARFAGRGAAAPTAADRARRGRRDRSPGRAARRRGQGETDRVNVEHMLAEHAHQARGLLRELKRPEDLDGAEVLRLRADEPASIRACSAPSTRP